MSIEDLSLSFDGLVSLGRYWLEWELALILLPWEWEIFKRKDKEWERLEACLGPFYIDLYRGIRRDFDKDETNS